MRAKVPDERFIEPAAAAPENPTPLSEQAYRLIRHDILTGHIPPGEKLRIEALRTMYGLSNTPLREALNRLAAEQLVIADERRGFRSTPVSAEDFWDLTTYRLAIENAALTDAIRNGDDEWESGIVAAFHRMEVFQGRLGRERKPNDEWTKRHKEFHMALIAACGSARMIAACSAMFDHAERYRRILFLHRRAPRDARAEHQQLMQLALARKQAAAAALLRNHVLRTAETVTGILKDGRSPTTRR
jgi:GntR family transcriptional regulator, carbon starvation induced regulator